MTKFINLEATNDFIIANYKIYNDENFDLKKYDSK